METALISTEHLWYTVALGNCFHIDAESEPLWGYSDYLGLMGHLLHGTWEQKGDENCPRGERGLPTVHNNFNNAEIYLAPGHEASLTRVRALVCLLDATDLKVIVTQLLKSN